jgi:uncharacterized protein (DUF433 family)
MSTPKVVVNHEIMGGVPCVEGTRIPAETVISMLADGMTHAEILTAYPQLSEAALRAVLRYAASLLTFEHCLSRSPLEISGGRVPVESRR